MVDGVDTPCSMIGGEGSVQCPPAGCRSLNLRTNRVEYFHANSDGYAGYMPAGAKYLGDSRFAVGNSDGSRGLAPIQDGFFDHRRGPQNPERPLTQNEVGVIRQKLTGLLTDKCRTFINDLFKAAGTSYSSDILKGFDEVNDASKTGKGGFFWRYDKIGTTKDGQTIYAGGTASGVTSLGNGRVNINPGMSRLDLGNNALYDAFTALHETIHAITNLGDRELAVAVSTMPGSDPNLLPTDKNDVGANSTYWNNALKAACLPKGY
jgi:hypothetical protein